ncbi:hypothetical protein CH267_13250 [Rhodococcus sp. 06-621-2]|nr:GntR family transcriptional regulator [Rhodococcus sp. 06-621-2]OZC55535.1 hypothetical protein CH267_13250 [Rhodococcus sp. 06-621-2]
MEPATPVVESSAERAYRTIKDAIVRGHLAPGVTVSEAQLAKQLSMSRTPVHQATARLEAEGWIAIAARSGVTVAPLDPTDLENAYETLMALEGTAAARLARRPISGDDIDSLLIEACVRCEEALAADNLTLWAERDNEFHSLLLNSCGNIHLCRAASTVSDQSHRARLLTVELRPKPVDSNADHRRIVAAVAERNPDAARIALEEHRRRGMTTLIPIIRALSWGAGIQHRPVAIS